MQRWRYERPSCETVAVTVLLLQFTLFAQISTEVLRRLPRKNDCRSYEVLHLPRKMIAKIEKWDPSHETALSTQNLVVKAPKILRLPCGMTFFNFLTHKTRRLPHFLTSAWNDVNRLPKVLCFTRCLYSFCPFASKLALSPYVLINLSTSQSPRMFRAWGVLTLFVQAWYFCLTLSLFEHPIFWKCSKTAVFFTLFV